MTSISATPDQPALDLSRARAGLFEPAALVLAALGLAGSLYLSMAMGLRACPLCFYQRTFMAAVLSVLAVGRFVSLPLPAGTLSVLALPLAVAGLIVAAAHNWLVWSGTLVCPAGIMGIGNAPVQSLVIFAALTALLLPGSARAGAARLPALPRIIALAALGAVLALLSVLSAPPVPPYKPTYDTAGNRVLITCERANPV